MTESDFFGTGERKSRRSEWLYGWMLLYSAYTQASVRDSQEGVAKRIASQ